MAVSQSISLTQGTQSIDNNTTQVTFKWTSTQTGDSWNGYTKTAYYYVSINGGAETTYSVSYTLPKSSTKTIVSKTFTVEHNNDGTGSISIRTWMDTGISAGIVQKSSSLTLTTIPRASKINSFDGTDLDGNFSVSYTSYSSSFTNKLRISVPNVKALETFDYTSGTSFKLSQASLDYLYAYTSNVNMVQLGAVIETWNGSTKIGESTESICNCSVPLSVKPLFRTIIVDPVNITTVDGTSRNILIQEKNKIAVSVSGCKAGSGGSISSYKFEAISGTTVIQTVRVNSTSTSASASLGPFSKTGTLKFRVTVTDSRGRSVSNKGVESECTCYEYGPPSFSSFNAYRCNSSGASDDNGTFIKYDFGVGYNPVNDTNNSTVKIYYKTSSDASWKSAQNALTSSTTKTANEIIKDASGANIAFDLSSTYMIYATVTDNYNGSVKSSSITVFGASKVFNIRADGSGIAFGKMAESNNLFESKWPAKFDSNCEIVGNLTVGASNQTTPPTTGITVHDIRDAEITPDSFGDKNVNFYFDQVSNMWQSILHIKGWSGEYAAWELAGNAHNSSDDNTLKYRQGIGETWGDWQTVLTNKNISNYAATGDTLNNYLPLSGGVLTGKLTLDSDLYYATNNTAGIDCQNSDIINANGIYFKDASDSAGESINFYRSDGYWDTLYAANGALKFHPNRGISTALGGHTILNSSNIRRGTCTLSSSSDTTVSFSSTLGGTPTVILTPLTTASGVIAGKVRSVSSTGFTAIIGGSAVSSAQFAYLAVYI